MGDASSTTRNSSKLLMVCLHTRNSSKVQMDQLWSRGSAMSSHQKLPCGFACILVGEEEPPDYQEASQDDIVTFIASTRNLSLWLRLRSWQGLMVYIIPSSAFDNNVF